MTPDDVQSNCPKHVEFYSKNKFWKLVHLVGIIIREYIYIYAQTHTNVPLFFITIEISN